MRRLWKTVLPNTPHVLAGLSARLVVNHAGRDLVVVAGSDIPPPGLVSLAAPT